MMKNKTLAHSPRHNLPGLSARCHALLLWCLMLQNNNLQKPAFPISIFWRLNFKFIIQVNISVWCWEMEMGIGILVGAFQVHNSLKSLHLSILSLLSPHVITPQCPLIKWYLSQECSTLDPCQLLYPSYNWEENGSCLCTRLMIHGVHLLTWAGPAFIWVMLLNHVKVWPGLLGSWGTESWDMGHPVSYDHHTLGPLIGCWHHNQPLIGCWQLLRKGMGQTQTQGITRNTTNIVNRAVAPGDDTKPWWQCGAQTQTSL